MADRRCRLLEALSADAVIEEGRRNLSRYYANIPEYAALNVADTIATPDGAVL